MTNPKFLIGLVVGFLIYHFLYKKRQERLSESTDKAINDIKNNLYHWLKEQDFADVDAEKVSSHLINENIDTIETSNYSGFNTPQRINLL